MIAITSIYTYILMYTYCSIINYRGFRLSRIKVNWSRKKKCYTLWGLKLIRGQNTNIVMKRKFIYFLTYVFWMKNGSALFWILLNNN